MQAAVSNADMQAMQMMNGYNQNQMMGNMQQQMMQQQMMQQQQMMGMQPMPQRPGLGSAHSETSALALFEEAWAYLLHNKHLINKGCIHLNKRGG